jgi:toxin CcdB
VYNVGGIECMMQTPLMAAVPAKILKAPVASLSAERHRIVAALNFLFEGY